MRYVAFVCWLLASVFLACTIVGLVVVIEDSWLALGRQLITPNKNIE